MGSSYGEFVKHPRTPHLFGSKGTDDDKHMGEAESRRFLSDDSLIVEEKLDGTNVGIHFTSQGDIVLQCRGSPMTTPASCSIGRGSPTFITCRTRITAARSS